ncbi:mediator of RNA polymerase II transcription subunit 17 [Cryptomeria japonica]|uniref:mediator of RNA polymerase II transcription subunit 17 n=1 Tax=Cryptomeria japonica TaxID=3369 RepID=UPI0027D9EE23|nr:mediator of RNA polymerase II transcription subunit 17 [Cryptomeria japonica]
MADDPQVTVDKLPIKRLEAIEENGNEHYPPEISQEEKPLTLLRRMDFGMSIVKDSKKSKSSNESQSVPTWQWQGLVENLHEAQQELSIVLDLINHVEANDAVTVAGMTRPKQLPSEVLSDLAISASTKLQSFRHIGKYLKQTAKALEEQVAREARFYGALMRLQRNWKVKRQRVISAGPGGNAGFTIDLSDNNSTDFMLGLSTSSLATVHIDQDQSGMLAVHLPGRSSHTLHVGFPSGQSGHRLWEHTKKKISSDPYSKDSQQESGAVRQESEKRSPKGISKSVDEGVKEAQSVLREIQCAIFDEQVFDLVIQEALHPSPGVKVIGIRENFLQLNLGPEVALNIHLLPSSSSQEVLQDNEHSEDADVEMIDGDLEWHVDGATHEEEKGIVTKEDAVNIPELLTSVRRLPNPLSSEVFLQQIFHQNVLVGTNSQSSSSARLRFPLKSEGSIKGRETVTTPGLVGGREVDTPGLLRHYCMALSHRIYCYKVISELENLVQVPYLHLFTHPTWQSRISAWLLYLDIPQMVTHGGQAKVSDWSVTKQKLRAQFICKIVVHDESLTIEGEGTPNVGCLFKGSPTGMCSISEYNCGLSDLASVLLQQVASQLIYWLHEEALVVGMKVERDYLSLSFQLDNSDSLALVASIDQREYCVNWWLILNDTRPDDGLVKHDLVSIGMENKKFLGPLPLEALYGVLMDLVTLCSNGGES